MICVVNVEAVRFRNRELDGRLLTLARGVTDQMLHVDPGNGEWTLAENLGHIGEFPGFFAAQLDGFLDGSDASVGRLLDNENRLAGIDRAGGRSADDLVATMAANFARLQGSLDRLQEGDLERIAHNGKYGDETVFGFLDRYVLTHKAEHVVQLTTTIDAVRLAAEPS